MLRFPVSTEFNKRIPKQKFYEHLDLTPQVKRGFVEGIKLIYWRNKISEDTVHIAKGERVTEIEVFELKLTGETIDEGVLRQIDRQIPYHILFLLSYEGKVQAWIGYKEAAAGGASFKVSQYYHTAWLPETELSLTLEGLSLDAVYENLVRQIAGGNLECGIGNEELSLGEQIERSAKREKLQREIDRLEKLARAEKQPKKKYELVRQEKALKKDLEDLFLEE